MQTSKHAASKRGYLHKEGAKGNAWRAITRPVRRLPGWKKRVQANVSVWKVT